MLAGDSARNLNCLTASFSEDALKTNWQHQKDAMATDKKNLLPDEHVIEEEKQKLDDTVEKGKQQALRKHPRDSEQQ